jgi:formylglycine-generating enzyme required for sulfatase activity
MHLRLPLLSLFALLFAAVYPVSAETLPQAKERLERTLLAIESGHSNALVRLTEQYASSLKAIQGRSEVSGNLELMAVLDTEIQKAAQGRTITLDKTAPTWLQQTQTKLQADRAGLAQKRAQDLGSALRTYRASLEAMEAALRKAGLAEDAEVVQTEAGTLPARAKSLGVTLSPPTEGKTTAVAGQKAGPPPAEGQDWESRTSGEAIPFVWIPSLKIWAGKTEVTVAQFRKFKALPGPSPADGRLPVTGMSYDEAYDYGEWLSKAERAGKGLPDGWRVRLPTEEEWTALAACGQRRDYPWGPSWPPKSGNYGVITGPKFLFFGKKVVYDDGVEGLARVDDSGVNEWGLLGLGGNVWEACGKYTIGRGFNAWRGGCHSNSAKSLLRLDARNLTGGDERDLSCGFRLVMSK